MSISANLHQVQKMMVDGANGFAWLKIEDFDNNSFTVFMPRGTAQAIVDAWEAEQAAIAVPAVDGVAA